MRARYAVNQADFNAAGLIVDVLLSDQPANPRALALRALLSEQAGDMTTAALAAAAAAEAALNQPPSPPDPSVQRTISEESFFQSLRVRLWGAYAASFPQN